MYTDWWEFNKINAFKVSSRLFLSETGILLAACAGMTLKIEWPKVQLSGSASIPKAPGTLLSMAFQPLVEDTG